MNLKQKIKKVDEKLFHSFFSKLYCDNISEVHHEFYASQFEEYVNDNSIKKELECVDPHKITSSGRLDIIVRYLLFRDIVYGNISDEIKSLYCRTILARSGGIESQDFYSPDEKQGIDKHIHAAEILLQSIRENGFEQKYYIPLARDYGLYNGAHRIAAGLALNEKVWIRYVGDNGIKDMNFKWFCNNGFSLEDKIRVLRGFADIHNDCGIFVLYGTVEDKWDYILKQIESNMKVVGYIDLDFSTDYIAFENLIHEIYMDYDENSVIERKIELLKFAKLEVRIVLVSDEDNPERNLYEDIVTLKQNIRKLLKYDFRDEAYVTLHATDSKEEFKELKQVVLSVNNLKYLHMRLKREVRKEFLKWIDDYKKYSDLHGISIEDTCIVGSSPLEVVGIRDSTDIDIVVSAELRNIYGDGVTHLTKTLDIATRNYIRNYDNVLIFDEQLIYDERQYFVFMGCKFANVDSVRYRKSHSDREKDIKDVRRIDIYNEYYKFYDNKKVLQMQIKKELERRKLLKK